LRYIFLINFMSNIMVEPRDIDPYELPKSKSDVLSHLRITTAYSEDIQR
jgi:hypothetical protein